MPSLGGMPALYVTNQLFMFREGQRKADPMNDVAGSMSDEDLKAYADAIAALPAPEGVGTVDPDLAAALNGYRTSERAGFDPQMNEVAGELSPAEISDLAAALSRR